VKSTELETAILSGLLLLHIAYKINLSEEKFGALVVGKISSRTE
jgi:hypothetical protein